MKESDNARWPVVLAEGLVRLRPLHRNDRAAWVRIRREDAAWLTPWDATSPFPATVAPPSFREYISILSRHAKDGSSLPFAVEYNGELVGQLTVSGIQRGALWSAAIGYWITERMAGRGIIPMSVAMAVDHCFTEMGLHRVEINIRPENTPSLRVVEKLGFRDEGVREKYLHIQGEWRDHRTFALTREDVPEGLLNRYRSSLS